MDCRDARTFLAPAEVPALATPSVVEAREHVEDCEACQDFLRIDERLRERLVRLGQVEAPSEVRERVFNALAMARATKGSGKRIRSPRWFAGALPATLSAAALITLFLVGVPRLLNLSAPEVAQLPELEGGATVATGAGFVEDFLRRAVQAEHIESSDPSEVGRFLARELGLSGTLLPPADLDLTGAEICIVDGIRGAVVIYKKEGQVLYHYLIPRPGVPERAAAPFGGAPHTLDIPLPAREETAQTLEPQAFPAVVTWASDGLEEALVGDFPVERLLAMAETRSR